MLVRMFKINFRKMKRSYLLLFLTLTVSVAALAAALLVVRFQKLLTLDRYLEEFMNCDIAFCDVAEETEQQILEDKRFSQLGYVYDLGNASFVKGGSEVKLGALRNKKTEKMFYINPISGRYPERRGEICVDRIALRCSGYSEKVGQEIELSRLNGKGTTHKDKYKLVGIIEVQKQDEGVTYSARNYPEQMYKDNNMNYPFAYISWDEAKEDFSCDRKHILTNVAEGENAGDVLRSYTEAEAEKTVNKLHIKLGIGRNWATLCITGRQLEDGADADVVEEIRETKNGEADAYTKYFIPIFMALVAVVASVGVFDAVKLSVEERRGVYGILLGLGMTGKRIVLYVVAEFFFLLVAGILAGWGIGILTYQGLLWGIDAVFDVALYSALTIDSYYQPFIRMVTKSPWFWSALAAMVVTLVGLIGVTVDVLAMSPIKLEHSIVRKRKRKKYIRSIYPMLNRYVGRDSRIQQWIPHFLVCIIAAASVFGFLFFREKAAEDTKGMAERIESARIKGMDYYMKHTTRIFDGPNQYAHQSGVTEKMYRELEEIGAVDAVKGVVVNHSTALLLDRENMLCSVLESQSEYKEALSDETWVKLSAEETMGYFRFLGIDTDKQKVFHVPTVGIRDEDMEHFRKSVVQGEIHPEKLQTGEEVLVVLTDESLVSNFEVGSSLPLFDVTRPEELDNSLEILSGQIPKKYRTEDKAYIVSADGKKEKLYCHDTVKKCGTKVGAVVCIDGEEDSFFFDEGLGDIQVNLMAGKDAFQAWGLPNKNYTSVGVRLKSAEDSSRFDRQWTHMLQKAGYMDSIDVYSILREKERTSQQILAVFYAVFAVLLLIGMICIGNSVAMRISRMGEEQKILYRLGMTRRRLLVMYVRRYSCIGLAGAVSSLIPAAAYTMVVRYAKWVYDEAERNGTVDGLSEREPWVYDIPSYDMLNGKLIIAAIVAGIVAAVLLCLLVLLQRGRLGRVLELKEKEM